MEAKKKKESKYHEKIKIDVPFEEAVKVLSNIPRKEKKITKTKK